MTDDRPVWLEFFAGEGGTAMGIHNVGVRHPRLDPAFRVVCVDNNPKALARNPFESVCADAIDDFAELVERYDPAVIGGGPPCQDFSRLKTRTGKSYPRLIKPFRELLLKWGGPYVIENVETARPFMIDPILICGSMLYNGLGELPIVDDLLLKRHRLFESNVPLEEPAADLCEIGKKAGWWRAFINVHGGGGQREIPNPGGPRNVRGNKASRAEAQKLMGIDWMSVAGMNEAIPPLYSEHIARQVAAYLGLERAA
jgi:DNA (cytosine-5)-methyltransferase 1